MNASPPATCTEIYLSVLWPVHGPRKKASLLFLEDSPMKIPSLPFGAAILAVVVVLFTLSAHADTFAIYDLGGANSSGVYGITASGDVVIDNSECFLVPIPCYYINYRGAVIGTSMTPPALTYDNGSPCRMPSGFDPGGSAVCNGAYQAFFGLFNPNSDPGGLYAGVPPNFTYLQGGTGGEIKLNPRGDFAWVDADQESIFAAYDLTPSNIPEPASILLFGSGTLALIGTLRRRLS
jgi:PEP-CTERM motif